MNSAQWFKEFDLVIHLWQWHGSLFVTDYWNGPSGSGNEDQKKKRMKSFRWQRWQTTDKFVQGFFIFNRPNKFLRQSDDERLRVMLDSSAATIDSP